MRALCRAQRGGEDVALQLCCIMPCRSQCVLKNVQEGTPRPEMSHCSMQAAASDEESLRHPKTACFII